MSLKNSHFRVLVLLASRFSGYNNGALSLNRADAGRHGIKSEHTLYEALNELESRGLIEVTRFASRTPRRATQFALTWVSMDETEHSTEARLPTHTYREWKPPSRK